MVLSLTLRNKTLWPQLPSLATVIRTHDLAAKKSLGQNFILNEHITDRIAELARIKDKVVLEIGPGPGGLTRSLLKAGAKRVIALEKDERCLRALEELQTHFPHHLDLHQGDALETPLHSLGLTSFTIVANLPYNIGTRLLLNWCEEKEFIDKMVLMFQKEVAERLTALPKTSAYGSLSVWIQWQWQVTSLLTLPPGAFSPPPKIESRVVECMPRTLPLAPARQEALQKVLNTAFQQRRKMLRRSLKALEGFHEEWFERTSLSPLARPEELTIEEFCRLSSCLKI